MQPISDTPAAAASRFRDLRLDFWRGLCIIDMLLIHLIEQGLRAGPLATSVLFDYIRFAAGGFVFVSGLCVGAIHLPRARDPDRRRRVYRGLLWRALFILAVHYLAELSYMLLCTLNGEYVPLASTLRNIFLFQQGYDLLPFYVVMIALCPILLETMRRGFGVTIAVLSIAIFLAATRDPWLLHFPNQRHFFPLLWQLIFVCGLFAGAALPRYDRLSDVRKRRLTAGAVLLAAIFTAGAKAYHAGLPVPLSFEKVPLSAGEMLRYLALISALILLTDRLWHCIEPYRIREWVNQLGRRSLGMTVWHIWVVGIVVYLSLRMPDAPLMWLAWMTVAAALLWGIAWTTDRFAQIWSARWSKRIRFETAAVPAIVAGIVLAMVVANPFMEGVDPLSPALEFADSVEPGPALEPWTESDEFDVDFLDVDPGPIEPDDLPQSPFTMA